MTGSICTVAERQAVTTAPLSAYLRRGIREQPRGLGVLLAGVGIAIWGALAGEVGGLATGMGIVGIILGIDITAALFERRADRRAGRPFTMTRTRGISDDHAP
jgi:hypothetical protein